MALTIGTAPFSRPPGGVYNFDLERLAPEHIIYLENVPKRIRGVLNGVTIVETRGAKMLHETGQFIQWYLPMDDVRSGVLEPSDKKAGDPFKGDATFYGVRVADRIEPDAAWSYERPPHGAPSLSGFVAFDFDRLDEWYEEDDQIFGHPRDPYHRFDCRRTSENVEVRVGGQTIAQTRRAIKLFETGVAPRYYIPLADVRAESLSPSDTRTYCPYKGEAAYYNLRGGSENVADGAWTLPDPLGEAIVTLDHVSFWHEAEVYADGKRV